MSGFGPRRRALLALAGMVAVGLALWLWPADEGDEAAVRVVQEVLEAARVAPGEMPGKRDQRLQEILDSHFEDPVTVRQADLPRTGAGRRALLTWGRLMQSYDEARLTAEQIQVGLSDDEKAATVRLAVVLNAQQKGESVDDRRVVEVRLRKRDGTWRIQRVDIQRGASEVPEARP